MTQIRQQPPVPEAVETADFTVDDDPLDDESGDALGLGVLLRTDFSNESAWQIFYARLQEAEAEFASDAADESMADADAADGVGPGAAPAADAGEDAVMDDEEDEDDDDGADVCGSGGPIFHVVNPVDADARATLAGLSNLAALRLLNDVDVRRAPAPPAGTKRIRPPNRLVDHDGWQEVYAGKTLWVYDARSNADQCVRLVSQAGAAMYGTAT